MSEKENKKRIFNTEVITRRKNDLIFLFAGLFLLFVTAYIFVDSIMFLATSVDTALSEDNNKGSFQTFNLQGLKNLNLLKPEDEQFINNEKNIPIKLNKPDVQKQTATPSPSPVASPTTEKLSPLKELESI